MLSRSVAFDLDNEACQTEEVFPIKTNLSYIAESSYNPNEMKSSPKSDPKPIAHREKKVTPIPRQVRKVS